MKILQINAIYGRGSTGRMVKEMHEHFRAKGHDSVVFASGYHGNENKIYNIGCKVDYLWHSFLSKLTGLQGYYSIISTLQLIRRIDRIKPDIVHLHNLHNNYINLPILFRYLKKRKQAVVITLHDFWFMTGHCCYYTNNNCMKWQEACGKCPAIKTYNNSWFFDNSTWLRTKKETFFGGLDKLAVIGNSKWTTSEASKSFLGKATILDNVYNWINTDVFYPRSKETCRNKYGYSKSDFIVLGVAIRWNNLKGLEIFEKLAKRNPNYKFLLVGDFIEHRELPFNIELVGTIKDANTLAEYYSLADVYVNPSIQETFGLVTAEAISCGIPVIANNATATPELVLPGCGYTIENNNIQEIENDMSRIQKEIRDPEEMHQKADKSFGKCNIDKYLDIYQRLLAHD